jgi:hypothetical protein
VFERKFYQNFEINIVACRERLLTRIFGPKRDDVTGDWRKVHTEKLHNLYSSQSIIRMIKSRRMRCSGHVARMGRRMHIGYWWGSQKEETTRKT